MWQKLHASRLLTRLSRVEYAGTDGKDVMAVCDPPYYLTADYQQNTILGLERVSDNWSYTATRDFLKNLLDKGDGLVYTGEAWWFKESYAPNASLGDDFFGEKSDFDKEQGILLDIINGLDHFDVAGRVVGRQEVLGVHHGHATEQEPESGTDGNAVRPEGADNQGRGSGARSSVLAMAAQPEAQGGNDGTSREKRGRHGAQLAAGRAGTPAGEPGRPIGAAGTGKLALAREVVVQHVADAIEAASPGSDENKVAGLALEEETVSLLKPQASGDDVMTAEDFASWSTSANYTITGASAQGARSSVRRAKNLMAVKNIDAKDLLADLERGSLINPSIGIIAPGTQFTEYGEITLVLDKNAITADTAIWEGDRGKKELADSSQAHIRVRPTMKEPTLLERQAPPLRQKQSRGLDAGARDQVNLTISGRPRRCCHPRRADATYYTISRRIRARPRCAPPSVVFGAWVLGAFAASPLVRGAWRKRNDRLATSL